MACPAVKAACRPVAETCKTEERESDGFCLFLAQDQMKLVVNRLKLNKRRHFIYQMVKVENYSPKDNTEFTSNCESHTAGEMYSEWYGC